MYRERFAPRDVEATSHTGCLTGPAVKLRAGEVGAQVVPAGGRIGMNVRGEDRTIEVLLVP